MSEHVPHHHNRDEEDGPRPRLIAVASQNGRTVTPHAGRTRRFLLFTADADGAVAEAGRYELPKAMTLHGWPRSRPHPLFCVDVVVVGGAGENFRNTLAEAGVRTLVTPDLPVGEAAARAVADAAGAR